LVRRILCHFVFLAATNAAMVDEYQPPEPARCSSPALLARLSAMMFLQYWPLGTWGVTVGTYIAANTGQQGAGIFSAGFVGYSTAAGAIGSLLSPVAVGFLSDRFFSAQVLLALMHFGCALAVWGMYESQTQTAFFLWLLLYFQCFVPAATLTNKIALKHLADVDAEYPFVRIFGSVGWIVAGLFLGFLWPLFLGGSIDATRIPLLIGAWGSLATAIFSLTLPHTPPERRNSPTGLRTLRGSDALVGNRPLMAFLFVSMLACIPSMAYNNYGNLFLNNQAFPRPAALMTLGQISDVLCLWATPWLIARFGLRSLFVSGVIAWGLRYVLLAAGSHYFIAWPVYVAILIHGPCYVFVYVIGVMYVDRLADAAHRGAAQGMNALATTGLGHLLGAMTVGFAQQTFLTPDGIAPPPYNWAAFWLVPAAISGVTVVLFQFAFRAPRAKSAYAEASTA
jgi:nucleoside transporter